ncbi:hypothetical protein KL86DES1_20376 [uncultured Desulfovibrio sp.]|uniref:Uncharacterized protein n=1 Tax=uncultured Desulfovibrio sp. TaxID=167968 RepID=A0A212L3M2_9BACT|nr:hypothetical protein KL86DES1_20376 [uncultured Desulfovibrio sp.]VZH33278.1 conserved protein of unknown function [Desulfovibrio sp. 86]
MGEGPFCKRVSSPTPQKSYGSLVEYNGFSDWDGNLEHFDFEKVYML